MDFVYQKPFPLGKDSTPYRLLTEEFVSVNDFEGKRMLKVSSEGLTLLAETAFRDVAHLLRTSHLELLARILKDPEASQNDRYVALEMLKNAVIIDEKQAHHDEVTLGAVVTIVEGGNSPEEYHVVGAAEADPTQGKISNESPLGRGLMGRRVGDSVQVSAPAGLLTFRIGAIK